MSGLSPLEHQDNMYRAETASAAHNAQLAKEEGLVRAELSEANRRYLEKMQTISDAEKIEADPEGEKGKNPQNKKKQNQAATNQRPPSQKRPSLRGGGLLDEMAE